LHSWTLSLLSTPSTALPSGKHFTAKGIPDIILHLITALHENTGARIGVGQKLSSGISTTSGVRQGCILAPILFCVAIDWIIQHRSFNPGITVGSSTFTDLVYADDTALLLPSATDATTSLKSFSDSASHLGLNVSWPKTKLQNIGSGPKPPDISVDGNTVESVNSFVYLDGSLQSSDGQCRPDLTRRIGLACAVLTSLKRIWSEKRLTLDTKLRIYQTRVLSVLLYATDTWTSLSADVRTLDAFHQKCLRQLLGIRWYDRVRIEEVLQRTGLISLSHLLSHRRISVFGHVA